MDVDFSLENIADTARFFLKEIDGRKVIAFYGEMGAGKTTFIRALCNALGVRDKTGSPTFSIINEYKTQMGGIVYHMDLYRLKGENEAIAAGVEDCLYSGNLCFVEWPEKAAGLLPDATLSCYLLSTGDYKRKLQIKL